MRPVSTAKTRTFGSIRQAMSRIAMPSIWKLVHTAIRFPNRSIPQRITSWGSSGSSSTAISPASYSSRKSCSATVSYRSLSNVTVAPPTLLFGLGDGDPSAWLGRRFALDLVERPIGGDGDQLFVGLARGELLERLVRLA